MEINDKKFTRTRKVVNFLISFVLAVFLILLSNTIIGDLDSTIDSPYYKEFADQGILDKHESEKKLIQQKKAVFFDSQANIQKMITTAKNNKEAEQQSFDNWLQTRSTLGKAEQDPEVLKRLHKLDEYQEVVQSWQQQYNDISESIKPLDLQIEAISDLESRERDIASDKYDAALNSYDIKVFLIRLLFTAPILALGIFLFLRYRRHKFSPLYMGFSLFSVYVFFVGLVPYLPSYGGYIRYTVGVLLTIGLGYYAIKRLKAYQDRKAEEMKVSSTERASKLQGEIAEKAFNNHVCPSCGKDFLLKSWESIPTSSLETARPLIASNYCRYCGLELVKKCSNCKQDNYAHLPYCLCCGTKL